MRLIDADDFIKKFSYAKANTVEENVMCATIRRMIKEQPTAFDVDKVVEQLKRKESEAKLQLLEDHKTAFEFSSECRLEAYEKAIEIVKGGGAK